MKALFLSLLLLLAPLGASANTDDEMCFQVSTMIFFAATGRDMGASPQDIIDGLVSNGVPLDNAMAIGKLIFIDAPNATPNELAEVFFNFCTSEAV